MDSLSLIIQFLAILALIMGNIALYFAICVLMEKFRAQKHARHKEQLAMAELEMLPPYHPNCRCTVSFPDTRAFDVGREFDAKTFKEIRKRTDKVAKKVKKTLKKVHR